MIPTYKAVADHAVLVEFATEVSDTANAQVIALDKAIAETDILGLVEVVPAMVNLLVIFDPLQTDHTTLEAQIDALFPMKTTQTRTPQNHVLEVCYSDDLGPDLQSTAAACGLDVDALINAHLGAKYRVSMYGFAPGYAYLSGVPKAIQVPRKTKPVRDVRAGSVMIAGAQCLATTLIMPTGWSIIGYTPAKIMRNDPAKPFLFDVGDTVSFKRIRREALPDVVDETP